MSSDPAADTILGLSGAIADDDTEGCLCLVVGYASKNGLIARVTTDTAQRVMLSPALGDFLQLRYVDLGPRPGPDGDRSGQVRRIASHLMTVQEGAGRNYFALIMVAKLATTVENLVSDCAADPFLASLRMRCTGIASSDDRKEGDGLADITTSPDGSWRTEEELIDALHQRCEELPRYFAARGEPGLTRTDVAALRQARADLAADGNAPGGTAEAASDELPVPDVLGDTREASESVSSPAAALAEGPDSGPTGSEARMPAPFRAARWLAGIPFRRGKRAVSSDDPGPASEEQPPTTIGLAYLLMIVDRDRAADPALDRLQDVLLDVDRRLATQPWCEYQVRVFHGNDMRIRSEPQTAGRIARRTANRFVWTEDFSAVLKVIRGSLRHDRELVQSEATAKALSVAPSTVIIFTADPPMPETGAAAVLGDIAANARVVWVVPRRLEGLVSPAFSQERGVTVLGEHPAVADDVLDVMHADVRCPERIDRSSAASSQPEPA